MRAIYLENVGAIASLLPSIFFALIESKIIMMDSVKEEILQKLEHLPEPILREVRDFIEIHELYEWHPTELSEYSAVKYIEGILVVQAEARKINGETGLETAVHELREERLMKFASW